MESAVKNINVNMGKDILMMAKRCYIECNYTVMKAVTFSVLTGCSVLGWKIVARDKDLAFMSAEMR